MVKIKFRAGLEELEAHLMVPACAFGFIEQGQHVHLRLAAFAYQKFGQVKGIVLRVERSPIAQSQPSTGDQPRSRIPVRLTKQAVSANERTQHFKAGMTLEAAILQDRPRLIEGAVGPQMTAAKS